MGEEHQSKIFDILFKEDEITWQSIIYDLVKSEEMDPWDVDVSLISKKYVEMIKKLQEMDFRLSGKVVLASAILLKIKSNKLLLEDINALDQLINSRYEDESELMEGDEMYDELESGAEALLLEKKPKIYPRTPQPRKRKVSVFDLVNALERALKVQKRRKVFVDTAPKVEAPKKSVDISLVIKDVYERVISHFDKSKKLTFSQLLPSDSRDDKVLTFIPLLHLTNQRKTDLHQPVHFGEIEVHLVKAKT